MNDITIIGNVYEKNQAFFPISSKFSGNLINCREDWFFYSKPYDFEEHLQYLRNELKFTLS